MHLGIRSISPPDPTSPRSSAYAYDSSTNTVIARPLPRPAPPIEGFALQGQVRCRFLLSNINHVVLHLWGTPRKNPHQGAPQKRNAKQGFPLIHGLSFRSIVHCEIILPSAATIQTSAGSRKIQALETVMSTGFLNVGCPPSAQSRRMDIPVSP